MDDSAENTCDICKISYASETELKDHVWSLMHHIKIEQKKKGSIHKCNLCFTSCSNIIEYGKHLNEDKHKRCLADSRRPKDDAKSSAGSLFDNELSQADRFGREDLDTTAMDMEARHGQHGFLHPSAVDNKTKKGKRKMRYERRHQRSLSQPDLHTGNNLPSHPGGRQNGHQQEGFHHTGNNLPSHPGGRQNGNQPDFNNGFLYDNGYPEEFHDSWNFPPPPNQQMMQAPPYPPPGWGPGWDSFDQFSRMNLYTPFDEGFHGMEPHNQQHVMDRQGNFFPDRPIGNSHRSRSYDRLDSGFRQQPDYSGPETMGSRQSRFDRRHDTRSSRGMRGRIEHQVQPTREHAVDTSSRDNAGHRSMDQVSPSRSTDSNSSENSAGMKRRREPEDSGSIVGKSRRSNESNRIDQTDHRKDSPSKAVDSRSQSSNIADNLTLGLFDSDVQAVGLSSENLEFLKDRVKPRREARLNVISPPPVKGRSGKQVTWADDTAASQTKGCSGTPEPFSTHSKSEGHLLRPRSRSKSADSLVKPADVASIEISERKAKRKEKENLLSKGGVRRIYSKDKQEASLSTRRPADRGESVLQKAEKLCRKLREEREIGKREKEKKEKLKKVEKHVELNTQIQALSEKNKENITGRLMPYEQPLDSSGSTGNRMPQAEKELAPKAVANGNVCTVGSGDPTGKLSSSTSSVASKQSSSPGERITELKSEIEKIRENIESSVRQEKGSLTPKGPPQPDSPLTWAKPCSPVIKGKHLDKQQKPAKYTDSLIKIINSPRTRKEQTKLAHMLRSYANRKTKLSLPRFNLHSSDLVEEPHIAFDLQNLSPDVQLEIANFIEADVKPDISELERMLEMKCKGEVEVDLGDLMNSPARGGTPRSPTMSRLPTGIADVAPSLSIDDLSTEVRRTKDDTLTLRNGSPSPTPKSPLLFDSAANRRLQAKSPAEVTSVESQKQTVNQTNAMPNIKQEKLDPGYDKALQHSSETSQTWGRNQSSVAGGRYSPSTERTSSPSFSNRRPQVVSPYSSRPVENQSIQSSVMDDLPVRDQSGSVRADMVDPGRSALEKVTAILEGTPSPNTEDMVSQPGRPAAVPGSSKPAGLPAAHKPPALPDSQAQAGIPPPAHTGQELGRMGSSQGSVSSGQSVLDEVYDLSLKEENVREELSVVDMRILQLKRLMDEASQQLKKFTDKKDTLLKQEGDMRSHRIRLLQDSRSLQSSNSSYRESPNLMLPHQPPLTEAQMENFNNPLFVKFLMSQKQSDLSSVGGYSNVETGSAPEPEHDEGGIPGRRGSITSDVSTASRDQTGKPVSSAQEDQGFLTRSMDVLTGSAESVCSGPADDTPKASLEGGVSLLKNAPLADTGFITLDSLMQDNSDLGKLLRKSLEGSSSPTKQASDRESHGRERQHSMSGASDDLLLSGSDVEKRSGKISMKFMGTLPDGIDYNTFLKQVTTNAKNPKVSYTVIDSISSPEAVSQLKKKLSDSGLGTSTPQQTDSIKTGMETDGSVKTGGTLTENEFEVQSVKSTYSLGEQIKQMCAGQNSDVRTPRSDSEGSKTLEEEVQEPEESVYVPSSKGAKEQKSPRKSKITPKEVESKQQASQRMSSPLSSSPLKKKLKSKKERDKKSRRKQKETFILETSSDGNDGEDETLSAASLKERQSGSVKEEDMVETGSEDLGPNRTRRSLLDQVQLETPSDSATDDRTRTAAQNTGENLQRLKIQPAVLEQFRSAVKNKLGPQKPATVQSVNTVKYQGPEISVAAMQVFRGDLYVCYNGSELRRFNLKTGEILKELDCSPYLVQCMHITSIEEREDVLFTGGACKKLMLFKPKKFNIIQTYDYDDRIMCLQESWGRLFVGLSDGVISVRSLKTDKELNSFQCTDKAVVCIKCTSAGLTKMLCCATADKIIYIMDAMSGLLITMLEGHGLPPLCMQAIGDVVVSGSANKDMLVHNVGTGALVRSISDHKAMIADMEYDGDRVYTASYDKFIRCYSVEDFQCKQVFYGAGRNMLTCILVHNGKVLSGNREGFVESLPLTSDCTCYPCECEGCGLLFGIEEHLLHHVMTDHILPNSRMVHCPWHNCAEWLSTQEGNNNAKEHLVTKHLM